MSANSVDNKKDIYYITCLSVISAISVVILHGSLIRFDSACPSKLWIITNFIMCLLFFAVPIFYMISGATLMDYRERYDTKTYFLKRFKKVGIPFIFWVIFYCLFRIYYMKIPVEGNILLFLYNDCIEGSIMWFFIPLFAIYLIIPLLNSIPKEKRIKLFTFYSILIFIFVSLIPSLIHIFSIPLNIRPEFIFASGLFIYPLLGYVLNEINLSKKYRMIFYVLGILGLLAMFLPTQSIYDTTHQSSYMFKSYAYPSAIVYSVAVWIFIKQLCNNYDFTNKFKKIVYFFKPYTFGLYMVHFYLIIVISRCLKMDLTSFSTTIIIPIIVIPISILILYVMKKIPLVRNIVPN